MDAVRGRLITLTFARQALPSAAGVGDPPRSFVQALERWWERVDSTLGPASSVRAVTDAAAIPLLRILGFDVVTRHDNGPDTFLRTSAHDAAGVAAVVINWRYPFDDFWRSSILRGIEADARWCFLFNGPTLRMIDGHRTWTRDVLDFDLGALPRDQDACRLFWCCASAHAMRGHPPLVDRLVELSSRHGVEVCRALGTGVLEAVTTLLAALSASRRREPGPSVLFDETLTVLYRVLFLLFAEARGLVPIWHPVYRDRYSMDAIVATLLGGRRYRGLWQAIQAISRLAHGGCVAGELRVTAFNGRLFSPSNAASFDRTRIDDETLGSAILAVSTTSAGPRRSLRTRIAYADLDVEQLGAVYQQVLEYEPGDGGAPAVLTRTREARKASGTFYTPRAVTAHLVQRTLEPLVRGRTATGIFDLRVVDPAMGSGAFLVAACRYLAAVAEQALIREGTWHPGDVTAADRVRLRRDVASRCLYGVDLNPMAVQLARLSLWLATLAADKPLSFLDHHLVSGDSLVGACIADVERQPSKHAGRSRQSVLPLFEGAHVDDDLADAARLRLRMASQPDDSVDVVREKERALAALRQRDGAIGRWSAVLDLWCAGWFWNREDRPDRTTFGDLVDRILRGRSSLAAGTAAPLLSHAATVAEQRRFLHWPVVFPEIFTSDDPAQRGFDAVIGNPPWDMMRGDSGSDVVRRTRQRDARLLGDFVHESGIYRVDTRAHANRYQLFVERALQLLRGGGRLGFVVPSGIVGDAGAAALRRHLFDRADIDAVTGLDNRAGIFPIHRSLRFVLLTCTAGGPTSSFACRFGITRPEELDTADSRRAPIVLTRRFLERVSGPDDLGVPEIATAVDLRLVEEITARVPWLGSPAGWNVSFGRELNATDDRDS
ncbi:MAG: Eco57I restriction-modification methylase domain-containing protein, partial [Deltaproteobacteria bacterium]